MSLIGCMIYQFARRNFYAHWNDRVCGRRRIVLLSKSFPVTITDKRGTSVSPSYHLVIVIAPSYEWAGSRRAATA